MTTRRRRGKAPKAEPGRTGLKGQSNGQPPKAKHGAPGHRLLRVRTVRVLLLATAVLVLAITATRLLRRPGAPPRLAVAPAAVVKSSPIESDDDIERQVRLCIRGARATVIANRHIWPRGPAELLTALDTIKEYRIIVSSAAQLTVKTDGHAAAQVSAINRTLSVDRAWWSGATPADRDAMVIHEASHATHLQAAIGKHPDMNMSGSFDLSPTVNARLKRGFALSARAEALAWTNMLLRYKLAADSMHTDLRTYFHTLLGANLPDSSRSPYAMPLRLIGPDGAIPTVPQLAQKLVDTEDGDLLLQLALDELPGLQDELSHGGARVSDGKLTINRVVAMKNPRILAWIETWLFRAEYWDAICSGASRPLGCRSS